MVETSFSCVCLKENLYINLEVYQPLFGFVGMGDSLKDIAQGIQGVMMYLV